MLVLSLKALMALWRFKNIDSIIDLRPTRCGLDIFISTGNGIFGGTVVNSAFKRRDDRKTRWVDS